MHTIFIMLLLIMLGTNDSYASDNYVTITDINIAKAESLKTKTDLLLVFIGKTCGPCEKLKKEIAQHIDEEVSKKYTVCYVEYSTNPNLVKQYQVRQIPYSVIVGKSKAYVGFRQYEPYKKWLEL